MSTRRRRRLASLVAAVAILAGLALPAPATAAQTVAVGDGTVAVAGSGGERVWTVTAAGDVVARLGAGEVPTLLGVGRNSAIVGAAGRPDADGIWILSSDGGVFTLGDAAFFGSTGAMALNQPVVGMAATPFGLGYWLVAADGGIFSFGDAAFFGSTGAMTLNQPVVGMAATPSGLGYWLVAADGGIFSFGDAAFFGSTGAIALNSPIIAMAAMPSGDGYWLLAGDGGVFAFGDAVFSGSLGAAPGFLAAGIATITGGYAVVGADGALHRVTADFVDPAGPTTTGAHAFLNLGFGGLPIRWDACDPIRYVKNLTLAPPGAEELLEAAVRRVEVASGLDLRDVGSVSGATGLGGQVPAGADAVVAFSTPELSGGILNGSALGVGGLGGIPGPGGGAALLGFVLVDATKPTSLGFSAVDGLGTLLQHELGHMVGLGHVAQLGELMFPSLGSAGDWGPGDREGLWGLGSAQSCVVPFDEGAADAIYPVVTSLDPSARG